MIVQMKGWRSTARTRAVYRHARHAASGAGQIFTPLARVALQVRREKLLERAQHADTGLTLR
jgi:hypothetical protein